MSTRLSSRDVRLRVLPGHTSQLSTALGTAFITLTRNPDGEPFEVFLNVGKTGSYIFASAEAIGRLISLALRLKSTLSRAERVRDIAEQLEHFGSTVNDASLQYIPDTLAKVLREFLAKEDVNMQIRLSLREDASNKQLDSQLREAILDEPSRTSTLNADPPATISRKNLPLMNISMKRN